MKHLFIPLTLYLIYEAYLAVGGDKEFALWTAAIASGVYYLCLLIKEVREDNSQEP